jgi:hypothetical protein
MADLTVSSDVDAMLAAANNAAIRTAIGLAIGTDVQAYSAVLAGTTASFTSADETKLDGIEAGADVTDATNVTAAGALMDSEVTNLAAVKAFDPTDYATAAQGALAYSATQPGDLAAVATSGDYDDLTGKPTLGTAAAAATGDFATAAQGTLADSAVQPSATQTLTAKTIASGSNTLQLFTESHASSHTLSAAECYGAVYYVSAAATLTLPAVANGMSLSVFTIGDVAVSVDPDAADKIWLDGVALDDGDKITNLSEAGDAVVLTYFSADGWYAVTNGWTDGGA